jgi:hypothetical protein
MPARRLPTNVQVGMAAVADILESAVWWVKRRMEG